jgi:hypothetical protein
MSALRPNGNLPEPRVEVRALSLNAGRLTWYLRRLQQMSVPEMGWRLEDQIWKWAWVPQQVAPGAVTAPRSRGVLRTVRHRTGGGARFKPVLPQGALSAVAPHERLAVVEAADRILSGQWPVLGITRRDMDDPDWFLDPTTGRAAPDAAYCFRVDYRSPDRTGNVKQIWELSRHHHVTVLAAAFALTGEERYAQRAAQHLRSWWRKNPFLSGVHWTSGIELGLRLVAWVWARRLLDGWDGAAGLFEENEAAVDQVWWHQRYLARFRSRGSSANNHVIAEAAGQLVAALAFDWFEESESWAAQAAALLEAELARNTFASGVNREMAFDYHGFVAELGLLAAAEADRAGRPLSRQSWQTLCRMVDVVAATVDVRLRGPRQGDSDDGRGLVLGPPEANRWAGLLALGGEIFGALDWWPPHPPDVTGTLVASLARQHSGLERPARRPSHFADAGLTIMRGSADGPELWCRCDAGPHGFLSIAAHAHADALAVEVRHDGTDILADPGTYCYQGEREWRGYFRSTLGHNTVEIGRQDQSTSGGATMWTRHAGTRLLELETDAEGNVDAWSAEHDGYAVLSPPARHQRTVKLARREQRIEIVDVVETGGPHPVRICFHLGPGVSAEMEEGRPVKLAWAAKDGSTATAEISLPASLRWSMVTGSTNPVLGWYSAHFGQKNPTTSLVGQGTCTGRHEFRTVLQFAS